MTVDARVIMRGGCNRLTVEVKDRVTVECVAGGMGTCERYAGGCGEGDSICDLYCKIVSPADAN